jgi:hypothetical protein
VVWLEVKATKSGETRPQVKPGHRKKLSPRLTGGRAKENKKQKIFKQPKNKHGTGGLIEKGGAEREREIERERERERE